MDRTRRVTIPALALMAALLAAPGALADGAFPDSLGLFVQGPRVVLAANFGLILSEDDGERWFWICEAVTGNYAHIHQLGPGGTLYTSSVEGLKHGTAGACDWAFAQGVLTGAWSTDVFPDPTDERRVLVVARPRLPDRSYGPAGVYQSLDGGRSFADTPLFQAQANQDITGVEIARSAPSVVYLTLAEAGSPARPRIVRSSDGGQTWEVLDAEPALGNRRPRIAAVDPEDPLRLYLRVTDLSDTSYPDTLAISDDGGGTFRFPTSAGGGPLVLGHPMTAFLRRANGSLLIGVGHIRATHTLLLSRDGGRTFSPVPGAPHVRALAERDGVIYAATDDFNDGFAVATSRDDGATWEPILRFSKICGPLRCGGIPSTCASEWERIRVLVGIPMDACGLGSGPGTPPSARGCRCSFAGGAELTGWGALLLVLRVWPRRRWRR